MEKCQSDDFVVPVSLLTDHCDRAASHKEDLPCEQCECCLYCNSFIKKERMEAHKPPCHEKYWLETRLIYFRTEEECDNINHDNNCSWGRPDCIKCVDCDKCGKHIKRYLIEQHAKMTCKKLPRDQVKKNIAERKAKLESERVPCTACSQNVQRSQMSTHRATVCPSNKPEATMNWPLDEHRCHILQHSKPCHLEPAEHCETCPHCLYRILRPIFLKHLEQCKERHVLEAL